MDKTIDKTEVMILEMLQDEHGVLVRGGRTLKIHFFSETFRALTHASVSAAVELYSYTVLDILRVCLYQCHDSNHQIVSFTIRTRKSKTEAVLQRRSMLKLGVICKFMNRYGKCFMS